MLTFLKKNKTKRKNSPTLYTSYRNTSISNVEMTSLWKMGLFTEVTRIALLCPEEASSCCDSNSKEGQVAPVLRGREGDLQR